MASLAEIRSQYPQYGDMSDGQLTDAIYSKFYSDLPRAEFDAKISAPASQRAPIYSDVVNPAPAAAPAPAEDSALSRIADTAKQAFGDQELGMSAETRNKYPGLSVWQPVVAAPADFIMRGLSSVLAGGSAAIAEVAKKAGMSDADANRLTRDLYIVGQGALIESGMGPKAPRAPAAPERAGAPKAEPAPIESAPVATAPAATAESLAARPALPEAAPAPLPLADTGAARLANEARAADAAIPESGPAASFVDTAARNLATADKTPERAGNINLDRIHAPEDVHAVIKQTAAENADFAGARRGTVSHTETAEMAELLGMSHADLVTRKVGQAFNAEEMFAARTLLVEQATKVRDLARRAETGTDAEKAQFAQEVTRLVTIQEQVAGATAEAGRALSQFRMMAGASKAEIARIVDASKASGIEEMAKKIASLDDPAQVANFASNAFKAKTSDMVLEAWINALLSGPTTHVANMLSNSLVAAWSIPESLTAAGISKLTGSGIAAREALGRVFGILEGAKDGIPAAWRAYLTEQPTDLASKLETRKFRAIPSANIAGMEIGGRQVRIPGRLLTAEDEFFKAIGYRQEINSLAMREALNEGLTGRGVAERVAELKANPTEAMREAARTAAEKQTFTNPLGDVGKALTTAAAAQPLLRFIVPFIKTPINIVKYAAERSPFAPLFREVRENLAGKHGEVARDNQIARIGLGSTVSAVAAYMAADGTITGGGPSDPAKRGLKFADGWQPYSVKVGDHYYSYSRFEPMGMLMGVASDFVELADAMKNDEKANLGALLMGSVSRNLVSKTWLRGPADLIAAVQDPQRYGPRYIQRLAGTVVPTVVAQAASADDPYLREARTVLDSIRSRIPGEREKLMVRRDAFGNPIKREGALGPDLLSPVYQSAAKNDPTIAEMLRLNVTPGRLPRTIRSTELTDAEYDRYSQVAGQSMKNALDALVGLPQWRQLPEAAQVEAMHDVIRKSRDVARTQVFSEFADLPLRVVSTAIKRKRLPASSGSTTITEE